MSFIDRFLYQVAPTFQWKREKARFNAERLRAYEAAKKGRRTDGWTIQQGASVNTENGVALQTLRDRSRDLVRNNPYAKRAIEMIANNVVGTGIRPSIKGKDKPRYKALKTAWKNWANKTSADFNRRLNFYGIERLVAKTLAESGEVFIIIRRRKQEVPICLQVVEPELVDTSKDGIVLNTGGYIMQGVQFDKDGQIEGYWMFDKHPSEGVAIRKFTSSFFSYEQVIHVFDVERPGQVRGVPRGVSATRRIRSFDEFEDAELEGKKVAAAHAGFIVEPSPDVMPKDEVAMPRDFYPGMLKVLPPGKDVRFNAPPAVPEGTGYARRNLQAVAAGFGVTYEGMTGDLTGVNFSSGRMGWIETHRNYEHLQLNVIIPQFCDVVWDVWLKVAGMFVPGVATDVEVEWTTPRREMIDPVKEIGAKISEIRAGLTSLPEALRESGYDPDDMLLEYQQAMQIIDSLGLVLDSDPRRTMKSGTVQNANDAQAGQV